MTTMNPTPRNVPEPSEGASFHVVPEMVDHSILLLRWLSPWAFDGGLPGIFLDAGSSVLSSVGRKRLTTLSKAAGWLLKVQHSPFRRLKGIETTAVYGKIT